MSNFKESYPKHVLVNNIKLPINASFEEAFSVAKGKIKKLGLSKLASGYRIFRRSIDARRKDDIKFVYSVLVSGDFFSLEEKQLMPDVTVVGIVSTPDIRCGDEPLSQSPIVVGAGPCGLFAALILAEHGFRPIILERGGSIFERQAAVNRFYRERILSEDNNIQFGAGGAGTFSDGKLVTRINDSLTSLVLERFIEFGASEDIRYVAKPHIGTDVLSIVVDNMIKRICELGGKIMYHTKFIRANYISNRVTSVETSAGRLPTDALILAIGHSSRDTYKMLIDSGYPIEAKSFSVGMRIEHLTEDIDKALYGKYAGHPALGHAEYNLSYDTKNRGVYTFCMCPGGEVVAATSEACGVCVNGMSNSKRDGVNSNSAILASVFKEDFNSDPLAAIEFQRNIEHKAFIAGGGDYTAPAITVGDFLTDKCERYPKRIMPTYMNGAGVKLARPDSYLPNVICNSIKPALLAFDKKIDGFAANDAVLTGAETRTSAPLRILRDNTTRLAIGYGNVYPAGEGAGYAGGITSASIDGIKTAIAVIEKYKPDFGR